MNFLEQSKILLGDHNIRSYKLLLLITYFLISCGSKRESFFIPEYEIAYSYRDTICVSFEQRRECFRSPLEGRKITGLIWYKTSNDLLINTERKSDPFQPYEERCLGNTNQFSIISDKGVFKRDLIEFDSLRRVIDYSLFGDTLIAVLIEDIICKETNQSIFSNPSLELYKVRDSALFESSKYNLSDSLSFFMSESSWNPTGTKIVLFSNGYGIYILDIITSKLSKISEGSFATWNPKHDEIAYLHKGDLWLYESGSGKSRLILKSGFLYDFSLASWHPTGDFILLAGANSLQVGIFSLSSCFWLNMDNGDIVEDKSCGMMNKSWR